MLVLRFSLSPLMDRFALTIYCLTNGFFDADDAMMEMNDGTFVGKMF